jgi:F0F1-type ATP synthase assembly protein I
LTPLIVAHAIYDIIGSLAYEFPNNRPTGSIVGLIVLSAGVLVIVRAVQLMSRGSGLDRPLLTQSYPPGEAPLSRIG